MRKLQEILVKFESDLRKVSTVDINAERDELLNIASELVIDAINFKASIMQKNEDGGDFMIYTRCLKCGCKAVPFSNTTFKKQVCVCEDCGASISVRPYKNGNVRVAMEEK